MSVSNPLFPNVVKTTACSNCGYQLPQELGQNDATCEEWVASSLKKLPKGHITLPTILDFNNFVRMCDVLSKLNRLVPKGNFSAQSTVTLKEVNKDG